MDPPVKPDESDCCNSGCHPCIFDVYEEQLRRYEQFLKNPTLQKPYLNCMDQLKYTEFTLIAIEQQSSDSYIYTFECDGKAETSEITDIKNFKTEKDITLDFAGDLEIVSTESESAANSDRITVVSNTKHLARTADNDNAENSKITTKSFIKPQHTRSSAGTVNSGRSTDTEDSKIIVDRENSQVITNSEKSNIINLDVTNTEDLDRIMSTEHLSRITRRESIEKTEGTYFKEFAKSLYENSCGTKTVAENSNDKANKMLSEFTESSQRIIKEYKKYRQTAKTSQEIETLQEETLAKQQHNNKNSLEDINAININVEKVLIYEPGQHFLIKALSQYDQTYFTRAYTPIPLDNLKRNQFAVLIRLYEQGEMSMNFRRLKVGAKTLWRGPYGDYQLRYTIKNILSIAQGTGISPIYSVIDALLNNDKCETVIKLFYCCRNYEDVLLRDKLYELCRHWNFTYEVFVGGGGAAGVRYNEVVHKSRLDKAAIENYLKGKGDTEVLVCGSNIFERSIGDYVRECGEHEMYLF